ncbi:MAG: holo-ACP synthase [Betaproteobacteria bacterium]
MIAGIGVDIVQVVRVEQALVRFGDRFAQRVLAPSEWPEFEAAARPAAFLAKRFAAKEAFGKALGTGIRAPATFHAIQIVRDPLGKPSFRFGAELDSWLAQRGVARHHLSLTDEQIAAVAMVVLESVAVP